VVDAVRQSNLLLPSGSLRAGDREYNVFANTQVQRLQELEDLVVAPAPANTPRAPVRLRDVARVVDGVADQGNIVRIDGRRGVYLRVLKQPGANTIAVVDALRASLTRRPQGLPPGTRVEISFDQSRYIRAAIVSLQHEALQGGGLAVLVILLFLRERARDGDRERGHPAQHRGHLRAAATRRGRRSTCSPSAASRSASGASSTTPSSSSRTSTVTSRAPATA
jgi:multidrug efflux pump subunit AcrB